MPGGDILPAVELPVPALGWCRSAIPLIAACLMSIRPGQDGSQPRSLTAAPITTNRRCVGASGHGGAMLRYTLQFLSILVALLVTAARADTDSTHIQEGLTAASRTVIEGHVKDGLDRLESMLSQVDPTKDKDAYWQISTTLAEFLSQIENHALAGQILGKLLDTKIPLSQQAYFQWMQLYLGQNLAYSGRADEGEKVLRALTYQDARLIHNPAQRSAAFVLSQIELDRGNVPQAAIWMRRAIIGTLSDKGSGSEEIVDALTNYAIYLTRTRRLAEAHNLFVRLVPIYDTYFVHLGPKYFRFLSHYIALETTIGNFTAADFLFKLLRENVAAVDLVAPSIKEELFYQDLYQLARSSSSNGNTTIKERLNELVSNYPDFSTQTRQRVIFSYFALVSGNVDLADQLLNSAEPSKASGDQYAAYEIILHSLIAARRNNFSESIALSGEALERLTLFHNSFENESASRLPAISLEERAVLTTTLALNATHVSTLDGANALFELAQFLNRDKGKLGLNKKVTSQGLSSDLQREDVRSRDRLRIYATD
jgi:hypothetical protein